MPTAKRCIPSEDIMPTVLKVLDLIVMSIKPKNKKPFQDVYSYFATEAHRPKFARSVGKQCVALTNKCLGSHRYKEAAKLLWLLCQDSTVFDMFIFKASLIVLENLEWDDKNEGMWKFFSEIQNLKQVNKKEVQLEYIIYGLVHDDLEIKMRSQNLISMKRMNYLRKHIILDPIFEAYCAYLESPEFSESCPTQSQTQQSQIEASAEDVILKLKSIIEKPGDWDIFVLKLIELQKAFDKPEEVEEVLTNYAQRNPDNLNAHIYLCSYLSQVNPECELLIKHLKIISEMSPSDERVLFLIEKWKNSGKMLNKCLKLIFMYLDYPSNSKKLEAWKLLSDFLYKASAMQNEKALQTIQSFWASRRKSWLWMYFAPSQVLQLTDSDKELVNYKVLVLSYFDVDHAYIVEVTKKFPTVIDLLNLRIIKD